MEELSMIQNTQEKEDAVPTEAEVASFIAKGYVVDSKGRPLHPFMIEQGIGLPVGKGFFRNWGPNYTADPVVITTEDRPRVLLIHRSDTGDLALPGGFVDPNEFQEPVKAAYRELEEETGLTLASDAKLIYQGPVDDPRATVNAWPETSAYLLQVAEPLPVEAGDDAREADWHYIDTLPENLYGSHAVLIQKALEAMSKPRTIEEILAVPTDERETYPITAGHMAYQHFFTRHQNDHLFVKAHDSSRFSDAFREAHSRAYLQKEYSYFKHLNEQAFSYIPRRVALIEDTILAMDALHEDDGWVWRAPNETYSLQQYLADTIEAFDTLQQLEAPVEPKYQTAIQDTYSTLWQEGWDAITDKSLEAIVNKIRHFSANWSAPRHETSEAFISALPFIKEKSLNIDRGQALFTAHNDARQSNIAWHPERGTRLVDWSWADKAPENADATMLLIDIAKSGKDVSEFLPKFNHDHAHTLIGFWLAHSLWETRDGSQTVREHQIASAVSAYSLIHQG